MEEPGWGGPGEANRAPGKRCCVRASVMRTSITAAAATRELSLATKTKNLLPLGICHAAENRRNCRAERSKHLALLCRAWPQTGLLLFTGTGRSIQSPSSQALRVFDRPDLLAPAGLRVSSHAFSLVQER